MLKQRDTRQVFNRSLTFVAAMSALIGIVPPTAAQSTTGAHREAAAHDLYINPNELKWEKLLPELGAGSPEITILHVDPVSGASQLMIRSPANYHAPRHWHTANET